MSALKKSSLILAQILDVVKPVLTRDALALYLNEYLACERFNDYAPNGLQIEGRSHIKRICTAVTASQDAIDKAITLHADALLVHHGYFWRGEETVITGMKKQRISELLKHDVNLYGYHLPLDCHLELGNNACLGQLFKFTEIKPHPVGKTPHLLWTGQLANALTAQEFADYVGAKLKRTPLLVSGTNRLVQHVAWCSGGAQDYIVDAHQLGVDAYLSGEISERTYYQAKELGLNYLACGHHATERYGIKALGEHLALQFDIQHEFIDSNNPV